LFPYTTLFRSKHPALRRTFYKGSVVLADLLPGLSVWSLHVLPVFSRGFLQQEPQQKKHAKQQKTLCRSLTKTDGSSHLVPGRLKKLPTAPGVLEEGQSGMG